MINKFSLDHLSQNYLIISSDIESRYEMVITKVSEYFDKSVEKILENPDVMYVSLPVIDKSGNIISTLSNYELQMREYGLLDKLDTNRIGNEITIDQIREVISFTQISAHKNKKVVIAACDTFRAAAIDQLKSWADKSKSDFFSGNINQDPASVAFQATEKFGADANYLDRSIYQVRAPGGTPRKLFETPGKLSSMSISPNADKFAFLSSVSANDPLAQSIFISNFRSPVPILITDNREESYVDIEWINNNEIIAHSQRGTKTFLSMINTDKKSDDGQYFIKDILYPEEIIQSFTWYVKTERLGLIMNSKKHPNELFIGKLGSNKIQQLTFSNPNLKNIALAKQESISWRSNDGKKIEGILTYPLRYGKG